MAFHPYPHILLIGASATALMDLWIYALHRLLRQPMTNWALAGRWFWHLRRGQIFHDDIAQVTQCRHELAIGWLCHYAIGVLYAAILILALPGWPQAPSLPPAWLFGMITILPGWFLMQPGMGAGIAAAKRPNAAQIRCLNVLSHSVFAIGLYATAILLR